MSRYAALGALLLGACASSGGSGAETADSTEDAEQPTPGRYCTLEGATRESVKVCEEACLGGNWKACHAAGHHLASGALVPFDYDKAASYYHRACQAKHGPSCLGLATLYWKEQIPSPKSQDAGDVALEYYRRACELGASGLAGEQTTQDLCLMYKNAAENLDLWRKQGKRGSPHGKW